MARIRLQEISGIARLLFAISLVIGFAVAQVIHHPAPAIIGALVGLYFLFAIKVVQQWEKVAVLRLGRYVGLRGPGMCHIIPIFETLSPYVDQRVRVASVSAESTLTRDTRETMGRELQRILDEKTNPWGITVQSVEIRDVKIPSGLEDAMSRQAQAQRERQARIILGQAESEISNSFVQAAASYAENPVALHLRAMNMLYEAVKEKGAMVIVPSSAVETMGLGGTLATASLGGAKP